MVSFLHLKRCRTRTDSGRRSISKKKTGPGMQNSWACLLLPVGFVLEIRIPEYIGSEDIVYSRLQEGRCRCVPW